MDSALLKYSDTRNPARIGLWTLGICFGGFLLWVGLAPLGEGVPTQGTVTLDTKRKVIQHAQGGLVREVLVKEGQFVSKDEALLRLDDAVAEANFAAVRHQYLTLRAMEGRLSAEQTGAAMISFHPDLLGKSDPLITQTVHDQQQLFQSRRLAQSADLLQIDESVRGQQASIQGFEGELGNRNAQQQYLQKDLAGVRDLVKEGFYPRSKLFELERAAAESLGTISELQGNIQRARSAIAELKMRAIQHTQEYRKEVDTQLIDVRREVQADAAKDQAVTQEMERMVIRAPTEGQVVGLAVQTVGGVIGAGQRLMDIVPSHETLLLETHVPPMLVDRVHAGLEVAVRFSSFSNSPSLVVHGKVASISTDVTVDAQQLPYYLARIVVTPQGIKELGGRQLQAGMPAEVVINTGERTVLTYLLHPLTKRLAASMQEE
jgi:protease secretion system membrane fusion protein